MIEKLTEKEFDRVYEIMREAFPFDEYRTYAEQKELLKNPHYSVYILRAEEDEIIAFMTVYNLCDIYFIEHFAIDKRYRSLGIGGRMLNDMVQLLGGKVCLEVELPQTNFAKRRIEFYKCNGFCINEYEYVQPPISKGKRSLPLILMTYNKVLCKKEFDDLKRTIYKEVYNIKKYFK